MELLSFLQSCLQVAPSYPNGDAIFNMEKADENFHRYAFVKHLQRRIEAVLGPMLDSNLKALQEQAECSSIEPLVPTVVEKIMASAEYVGLVSSVSEESRKSVSDLLLADQNDSDNLQYRWNERVGGVTPHSLSGRNHIHELSFSTHSNATIDSSSGSLSSFISPPIDEVKRMMANMMPRNPLEARLNAAQKFEALSTADLLSSEFWTDTRGGIEIALADSDVRTFKASPPPMTADIYLIIASHLSNVLENGHVNCLLRKFRLLQQFQMEMPSCWFRFPEQILNEVMNATFRLLRPSKHGGGSLTSLHYMAMVDTNALWFEKWMMSNFGRSHAVPSMLKYNLISALVGEFLYYACTLPVVKGQPPIVRPSDEVVVMDVDANDEETDSTKTIYPADLEYIHFLHMLVMLTRLSLFAAGRQCFPVRVTHLLPAHVNHMRAIGWITAREKTTEGNERSIEMSLETFIKILIKLMCACGNVGLTRALGENPAANRDVETHNLSNFVCKALKSMTTDLRCQEQIYQSVLEGAKASERETERVLINIAETLSNIAATDSGRKFILRGGKTTENANPSKARTGCRSELLKAIATFAKYGFEGDVKLVSLKVLSAYVFFLRQLYRTCEGLFCLEGYRLHKSLSTNLHDGKSLDCSDTPSISSDEWRTMLIDNLLNFAGTPKGVLLLQQSGSMETCVAHMFHRYEKKMQVSSREKFGYGVLVSQVSTTKPGMQALYKTGLLKSFIKDMWTFLESDFPFGNPHLEPDDFSTRKIVENILKALASFPGLNVVLELEANSDECNSFSHAIRKMVLLDRPRSDDFLITLEESHAIGLRILRLLSSSLDSFLALEVHFQFQESLLRLQDECRRRIARDQQEDVFVIDENSILRNHILVATYVMGGPSERKLPPVDTDMEKCKMFSQYPVPACYVPEIVFMEGEVTGNR
ncbi:hypothetical protein HK101_002077 [Irineochytrium annulatum]|nr:hypothetical protein HK101_002077 [Irineochytrium annulatum]